MKEWNVLPKELKAEINMLSGLMNLPVHNEYASLAHLIHDVRNRVSVASSLISQVQTVLEANVALEILRNEK